MAAKTGDAVMVSMNSPPIPAKMVEKIWRNEFIEHPDWARQSQQSRIWCEAGHDDTTGNS